MKICRFCGAENADDALFCNQCGKRMENVCPVCGANLAENARFCSHCGTPVLTPAVSAATPNGTSALGDAASRQFAPDGAPVRQGASDDARKRTAIAAQRVLGLTGNALALLAALTVFIFVFFIGSTVTGNAGLSGVVSSALTDLPANNLWYYFKDAYADVEDLLAQSSFYPGYYPTTLYLATVIGTVAGAVALVATTVFFILAVVRYLRNVAGKTEKSPVAFALSAFFSFLLGALLFLSAERFLLDASGSAGMSIDISAENVLNQATVAGICLGSIFLFFALACLLVRNLLGGHIPVTGTVLSALGGALAVAVFAMLAHGTVSVGFKDLSSRMTITTGFAPILQLAGQISSSFGSDYIPTQYAEILNEVLVGSAVGAAAQLAASIAGIFLLTSLFHALSGKRTNPLPAAIVTFVPVILAAAFSIYATERTQELMELYGSFGPNADANLTVPILVCVFAFLSLALSVAVIVIAAVRAKNAPPAQAAA